MKDPVCGMDVKPDQAKAKSDHHGQTYHFCSNECKQKFDKSPDSYAKGGQQGQQSHGGKQGSHQGQQSQGSQHGGQQQSDGGQSPQGSHQQQAGQRQQQSGGQQGAHQGGGQQGSRQQKP